MVDKCDSRLVTADEVVEAMRALADEAQARQLMRFFKTGPGDYGEGDRFLGIKVPDTRRVSARCHTLPLDALDTLLGSEWHEVRLAALLTLVAQFEAQCTARRRDSADAIARRDTIADFYLSHARRANNWDLVDLSVYKILGRWLMLPSTHDDAAKLATIDRLAASDNLWEQRMSIVCTMEPLRQGDASFTLRYAEWHLHHSHDLMHKAVGWLLREMGKRVGLDVLRDFLSRHAAAMPRTALRYAIERLSPTERHHWMTVVPD